MQASRRRSSPRKQSDHLSANFDLVVGSKRGLEGFQSSDDCEELMRAFFKQLALEYSKPFVCASAREPIVEDLSKGRKIVVNHAADPYGQRFVLKAELLDLASIACAGDFKNVMSKAFISHVEDAVPLSDYGKYFRCLTGLSDVDKRSAIVELHDLLLQSGKKFGGYVEVRLQGQGKGSWSDTVPDVFDNLFDDEAGEDEED